MHKILSYRVGQKNVPKIRLHITDLTHHYEKQLNSLSLDYKLLKKTGELLY